MTFDGIEWALHYKCIQNEVASTPTVRANAAVEMPAIAPFNVTSARIAEVPVIWNTALMPVCVVSNLGVPSALVMGWYL